MASLLLQVMRELCIMRSHAIQPTSDPAFSAKSLQQMSYLSACVHD
jgi:hypothetical protein